VYVRVPRCRRRIRTGPCGVERNRASTSGRLAIGRGDRHARWRDRTHSSARVKISFGFSPCPNDCFMFDAIVNRRIDLEGIEFAVHLADIEALNQAALAGQAQVTKISYYAYAHCADRYALLNAGSALGRHCGPLLISKRTMSPDDVATAHL